MWEELEILKVRGATLLPGVLVRQQAITWAHELSLSLSRSLALSPLSLVIVIGTSYQHPAPLAHGDGKPSAPGRQVKSGPHPPHSFLNA